MPDAFVLRAGGSEDLAALIALYRVVASEPGGLARAADEVTPTAVAHALAESMRGGFSVVAADASDGALAGELHCHALGARCFAHVLGDLTVAVSPQWQGRGVGRALFVELLRRVRTERPDIRRVELFVRESNARALALYESIGFRREGRFDGRVAGRHGLEADIPMAWSRE